MAGFLDVLQPISCDVLVSQRDLVGSDGFGASGDQDDIAGLGLRQHPADGFCSIGHQVGLSGAIEPVEDVMGVAKR